ncbi:MAG: hypothetical protein GY929_24220 [Actinomycetia bacterium]|nr:hypothetical protein [Actinomycetes bacterium]
MPRSPILSGTNLTRRSLLLGSASALALAACGGSESAESDGPAELHALAFFGPVPLFKPDQTVRAPVGIGDSQGIPLAPADMPDEISVDIFFGQTILQTRTAKKRSEGLANAYYDLRFPADIAGVYALSWEHDGVPLQTFAQVNKPEEVSVPGPGERLQGFDTPTVDDSRGVEPICTREPECGLHTTNLADSIANGQPTVLLVSTPMFCQTAVCGPVLELLRAQADTRPDITFIHAEVYANAVEVGGILNENIKISPAVDALHLTHEPSLFTVDPNGVIVERLDFTFDGTELVEVLDQLETRI